MSMTTQPSPEQLQSIEATLAHRFGLLDTADPHVAAVHDDLRQRLEADVAQGAKLPTPPESVAIPLLPASTKVPTLQELLAARPNLVTQPQVVLKLQSVLAKDTASAAEVANVISLDTKLTAAVLRVANSALYRPVKAVDSVSRAVALLGTRQITSLCLGAALISSFSTSASTALNIARFWRHALLVGLLARNLAQHLRTEEPEVHFVGGMLHDIGFYIIGNSAPEMLDMVYRASLANGTPLHIEERHHFGFTHADVGHALLEGWHFGPALLSALRDHHTENATLTAPHSLTICTANALSSMYGMPPFALLRPTPLPASLWQLLDINPRDLVSLCNKALTEFENISQGLGLHAQG